MEGPYDDGYRACPCFWGSRPARLVRTAAEMLGSGKALDVGCGDGKNAIHLSESGFDVSAFDLSPIAIENARAYWSERKSVAWEIADLTDYNYGIAVYDLVLATGPLHCLESRASVRNALCKIQNATRPGGLNVVSVFNDREQDLSGHAPSFAPILLPHQFYIDEYQDWEVLDASDRDLLDEHPHTSKQHKHSITRLLAKKRVK